MNRKTIRTLIAVGWVLTLIFLSILIGRYEDLVSRGFSQLTFLLGAIFGLISAMVLNKVDARFTENEGREKVTE